MKPVQWSKKIFYTWRLHSWFSVKPNKWKMFQTFVLFCLSESILLLPKFTKQFELFNVKKLQNSTKLLQGQIVIHRTVSHEGVNEWMNECNSYWSSTGMRRKFAFAFCWSFFNSLFHNKYAASLNRSSETFLKAFKRL